METTLNIVNTKDLKEYTGTAKRILKLLAAGVLPSAAAKATGVDDSYVSQLCAEEDFQHQIAKEIQLAVESANKIDKNYTDVEEALSTRLRDIVGYMFDPDKILRTLKFVNEAKRKIQPTNGTPLNGEQALGMRPVTIVLPTIIRNNFILNPNNEVVGISAPEEREVKELVTIGSTQMQSLIQEHRNNGSQREEEKEKLFSPINTKLPSPPSLTKKLSNGTKQSTPQDPYANL